MILLSYTFYALDQSYKRDIFRTIKLTFQVFVSVSLAVLVCV